MYAINTEVRISVHYTFKKSMVVVTDSTCPEVGKAQQNSKNKKINKIK